MKPTPLSMISIEMMSDKYEWDLILKTADYFVLQ